MSQRYVAQAQREEAARTIAKVQALLQVLDTFHPQPDDRLLDYDELLQRVVETVQREQRRVTQEA